MGRVLEASTGEELETFTIREWFTQWLEGAGSHQGEHGGAVPSHIRLLLGWLGADADKRLETLSRPKLAAFRTAVTSRGAVEQKGKPMKPIPRKGRTVNFILNTVSAGLKAAARDGLLLGNPCEGVERLGSGDSEDARAVHRRRGGKALQHAPSPEWAALMGLGCYAGLRLMDGAKLRWRNVDLVERTLSFVPSKTSRTGRKHDVPLDPRVCELLEALPSSDDPEAFVLPMLSKIQRNGPRGLSSRFGEIMDKAGVGRGEVEGPREIQPPRASTPSAIRSRVNSPSVTFLPNSA